MAREARREACRLAARYLGADMNHAEGAGYSEEDWAQVEKAMDGLIRELDRRGRPPPRAGRRGARA